jgi:translation initiation factor IF-3
MKKLNKSFRLFEVVVVNKDNSQTKMKFFDALNMASELGLDLVQMNDANKQGPIICKFMDYGKTIYEQEKKERESRSKQKEILLKEVQFSPNIASNDLNVKINRIKSFLEDGNKVKVSMDFRGRMATRKEIGKKVLENILENVKCTVEKEIINEKNIQLILSTERQKTASSQTREQQ